MRNEISTVSAAVMSGVNVELLVPSTILRADKEFKGSLVLFSEADQVIDEINIKLVEAYMRNNDGLHLEEELHLGEVHLMVKLKLNAGETRVLPFILPFEMLTLKQAGFAGLTYTEEELGEHKFFVEADVDVKGTSLDPSVKKDVSLK